jgi:hypothetical protein
MSLFFKNPFPVRHRPPLAFDYVIAYSNEKHRECECDSLIDVRILYLEQIFFFVSLKARQNAFLAGVRNVHRSMDAHVEFSRSLFLHAMASRSLVYLFFFHFFFFLLMLARKCARTRAQ